MEYYKNRHSCFLLQYHLVLITKFRHPVITGKVESFLKEYTQDYFKKQDCKILKFETNLDHIHILFEGYPNVKLSDFVNAYKSASSRIVRKNFPNELAPYYWKPFFWSNSYFVASASENSRKVVERYIENQKKDNSSHH